MQLPAPDERARPHITALGAYPVCAFYRFELPLRAMIARGWCGATIHGSPGGMFADSSTADGLTFEAGNPLLAQRHVALDRPIVDVLRANDCRFVHDLDDLLWAIPADNPGSAELSRASLEAIDTSLRLADLVTTTTEPLAAALEARGIRAVIVPNLLDASDWQVQPRRAERSRLRVGWYGQRHVHAADLDIVESVVAALSGAVDFVFYGDVPAGLDAQLPAIEAYPATALELFPVTLAMLDLDIVLAPLAKNAFNECKSNLRALQAGMLGYAVIATDIEPYRTLPVTLAENTAAAWIAAIRERVGELDAVRGDGRTLRDAVHERFTLDRRRLERIFTTWTRRAPPDEFVA